MDPTVAGLIGTFLGGAITLSGTWLTNQNQKEILYNRIFAEKKAENVSTLLNELKRTHLAFNTFHPSITFQNPETIELFRKKFSLLLDATNSMYQFLETEDINKLDKLAEDTHGLFTLIVAYPDYPNQDIKGKIDNDIDKWNKSYFEIISIIKKHVPNI